jgi:carboxymethylenebutenolidase
MFPFLVVGPGAGGVRAFYRDHLVGKFFPPDVVMRGGSRTVSANQVVVKHGS